MISYYDLLNTIKRGEAPDLIELKLNCGERYYQAFYDNDEFNYYGLCDEDLENFDFHYYLSDTLLESQMFDKCIKIIEQPKKLEKITWSEKESLAGYINDKQKLQILARRTKKLKKCLNEIIDKLGENNE